MRRWLCALLWMVAAVALRAQSADWVSVPFDKAHWNFEGDDAAPAKFLGRDAVRLHRGTATLKDVDFSTGSIEYDVSFQHEQEFAGLFFRAHDADADYFYLRPHESSRPDSNQYIPLLDHDDTWQIYSGPEYQSNETYIFGGWNHIRLEIYPTSAEVYINGNRSLRIAKLQGKFTHGELALAGLSGSATTATQMFYSNFRYRAFPNEAPADMPKLSHFAPPGLVAHWKVWPTMTESEARAMAAKPYASLPASVSVDVEHNGIANIGRLDSLKDGSDGTTLAAFTVRSDIDQTKMLKVGFSDRVTVFVNGSPVYIGDNSQYLRDPRFLGIVGLFDTIAVPLHRGENAIIFVVTEHGGGWAAEAQFTDMAGLHSEAIL
ncbi:MAG TPA: family 16 glycoside hydrolase [Acidobacteriaceae bacterium]|jgi:hypothetical protein